MIGAFRTTTAAARHDNVSQLLKSQYRTPTCTSIKISVITAVSGGLFGFLMAYAAIAAGAPRWSSAPLTTFSGVAAELRRRTARLRLHRDARHGRVVTQFLRLARARPLRPGFTLFSSPASARLPLLPDPADGAGDRAGDRRARANGERRPRTSGRLLEYWRQVGAPVLRPRCSAHDPAVRKLVRRLCDGLRVDVRPLNFVPLQIGELIDGNVLSDPHQGYALALGMIVVIAVAMTIYFLLDRRASRWRRGA